MSIFNKPYRNDRQLEADAKENKRRDRIEKRKQKNLIAQQIFEAVLDEIENNGKDNFSKREMVALVAGDRKMSEGEWMVWSKSATVAIQRIRTYYWAKRKDTTIACAFNYVNKRYWLIPLDDALKANIVYDAYDRKMKGIREKQGQLASSAYHKILELDPQERAALIQQLREENLLNNGQ